MDYMGQRGAYPGNTNLVEHGIQTEESDYRIHVSFAVGKAYIFPTSAGRAAIEAELGRPFEASQPGVDIVTGIGRKVPWREIRDCEEIDIPIHWLEKVDCKRKDGPSAKGRKAVKIARWLLMDGRVPIPLASKEIEAKQIQIKGKDLIVTSEWAIEVKCDYWGGRYGLALQTHECNPLQRY